MANLHQLLKAMVEKGASDLHLTTGSPPQLRVDGHLTPLRMDPLSPQDTKQACYSILTDAQKHRFEANNELDLSFGVKGLARFRANIFVQRGAVAGAFRTIPYKILSFEELGLPPVIEKLAQKPRGLILVTGPTGSGKSTTLAAMIDEINRERPDHIITIEDPIEFLHQHKRCVINQREIGTDATSFGQALRAALRQDPDVILLGEMRDLETISTALTAAETGHLVFGTLHTQSAPSTIDRMIDVFPAEQQEQVRTQIASSLQGVITQTLLPTLDGKGRVPALEILIPDDAIRNLIRSAKVEQIYSYMQTGSRGGMLTMEQSLADLVVKGIVHSEEAITRSSRRQELTELLGRLGAPVAHQPSAAGGLRLAAT
jgi:twitching motility protein PilT